jgi:biotin carboxyl carrier protein
MEYRFENQDETHVVRLELAAGGYAVTVRGETQVVEAAMRPGGELELVWEDGKRTRAWVAAEGERRWVALDPAPRGGAVVLTMAKSRRRRGAATRASTLEAQMPGVVRKVLVGPGERVERGQVLVLMEAMKMEIRVTAPEAGTVRRVAVREGESVQRGQGLVEVLETDLATDGTDGGPVTQGE